MTKEDFNMNDSVYSQIHLTHSTSLEFLRQFWLSYLSTSKPSIKQKELDSLCQSLKRTLERMEALRQFAIKESGPETGNKVMQILSAVRSSAEKAIALWEGKKNGQK